MADFPDGSPAGRLIPQLPDDLSIRCIARVPRSSHSALALVSRSWRSLLRSPSFFALRSDLGITQPFLCLNVRTPTDQSCWYLLDPADRRNPILLPAPRPRTVGSAYAALGTACAALGTTLFVFGGSIDGVPSAAVQLFDFCLRRWSLGPRMSAAREFAAAGAIGGRIYVIGGCLPPADGWAEALDPGHAAWSTVPSPPHLREKWMHGSAVLSGSHRSPLLLRHSLSPLAPPPVPPTVVPSPPSSGPSSGPSRSSARPRPRLRTPRRPRSRRRCPRLRGRLQGLRRRRGPGQEAQWGFLRGLAHLLHGGTWGSGPRPDEAAR